MTLSAELAPAPTAVGLKLPVAPDGSPLKLKLTDPLKPFTAATLIVYEVPLPAVTEALFGEAASVNPCAPDTLSVTDAVPVSEPLLPLIFSVELPTGVLDEVVIVSVELAPAATALGENVSAASLGNPLTLKFTVPLNPFIEFTVTV